MCALFKTAKRTDNCIAIVDSGTSFIGTRRHERRPTRVLRCANVRLRALWQACRTACWQPSCAQ
jgi:hypothetical protein